MRRPEVRRGPFLPGARLRRSVAAAAGCCLLAACTPNAARLRAVSYAPTAKGDWDLSTPAREGLDPLLVARLYHEAARLETLYGVLVVKNGRLVAERYFHAGSIDQLSNRMSMTKSVTSALVGLALEQGCLAGLDRTMVEYFPELSARITDPRKARITIRDMLQMRAGYPWEEHYPEHFDAIFMRNNWHWLPHVADIPLVADPGSAFGYSNLTSHLLAVITARSCKTELEAYAQEHLFSPIGARVGGWSKDADGHTWGFWGIELTARDMARFGLLYLHGGEWQGRQVVPSAWVKDSLRRYSDGINFTGWFSSALGRHFRDLGYGYQWWSASVGSHRVAFAWGHGGQLIVLLHELHMIIVTTADPLIHLPGELGWKHEGAIIDLVGGFIRSLPAK
jgi:CubicO group peptidase (beta-lactamase class C family)